MTKEVMESLRDKIIELGVSNVVVGDLPSLEINCVAISPAPGYANSYYFGANTIDEPLVRVVIRDTSYQVGQESYTVIAKKFDRYRDESVDILSCYITGSPGYLGRDTKGFHEWNMLFHLSINE